MHICITSDARYAPYISVFMCSFAAFNDMKKEWHLHLIARGDVIMKEKKEHKVDLGWVENVEKDALFFGFTKTHVYKIVSHGKDNTVLHQDWGDVKLLPHLSMASMDRILISHLLDPAITKVLYIDIDTLVVAPLEDLWEIPTGPKGIAAKNTTTNFTQKHALIHSGNKLQLQSPTFNSGVMMMDLTIIRKEKMLETCLGVIEAYPTIDQVPLNYYAQGLHTQLDPEWNTFVDYDHVKIPVDKWKVLHYATDKKPWLLNAEPTLLQRVWKGFSDRYHYMKKYPFLHGKNVIGYLDKRKIAGYETVDEHLYRQGDMYAFIMDKDMIVAPFGTLAIPMIIIGKESKPVYPWDWLYIRK